MNGPFACPSLCLEEGEWDTQASFSGTEWLCCLPTQRLSVHLLGDRDPGSGTGRWQWVASWTARALPPGCPAHLATVPSRPEAAPRVLAAPSPLLPVPYGSGCNYKDAIVVLSFETCSLETLVKTPSFPFGEGVQMADWATPSCLVTSL